MPSKLLPKRATDPGSQLHSVEFPIGIATERESVDTTTTASVNLSGYEALPVAYLSISQHANRELPPLAMTPDFTAVHYERALICNYLQARFQVYICEFGQMRLPLLIFSIAIALASVYLGASNLIPAQVLVFIENLRSFISPEASTSSKIPMSTRSAMSSALAHGKLTPRRSSARGHADHGWLNTFHTFSFADYYDHAHTSFGPLRVLNEDRVAPHRGFGTHPHRDAEIFSYILKGELTHRDSMIKKGEEGKGGSDDFYRMKRGDVQFTTGGTGIAHSEQNESSKWVHFLQIWALPWKKGLTPRYHTKTFDEAKKKKGFVPILSPLVGGPEATNLQEQEAKAKIDGTIPIHADLVMGAGIISPGKTFEWRVGGAEFGDGVVANEKNRKVYLHLAMTQEGKAKVKVGGEELGEGDGCYVEHVNAGDVLAVESIGSEEAELVVLDGN